MLAFALQRRLRHFVECLLHSDALDGARLKKHHVVVFLRPCLALGRRNLSAALLVKLVAQTHERERVRVAGPCIFDEPGLPAAQTFKAGLVCDVIDERAAVGAAVECVTQGLELFLACCIPDLERDDRVVDEHLLL